MKARFIVSHFIKNYENIEDKNVRERYGIVSGIVGVIVNLILFILEVTIGMMTNSISIIADAFHNLADVTSSIVTLIGFKIANKPADKNHPFGHGRIEYISALLVSFFIILIGIQFIKASLVRIFYPEDVTFNLITFSIIIMAIPLKLWLSYFNKSLGKMINSVTLEATSRDALNDVAILLGVIVTLVVSFVFKINIDGYVGGIVAIFIILSGVSMVKETINPLLWEPPDPKLVNEIEKLALGYDNILGIHDLIIHSYGPGRCMASFHAEVPYNISIIKLHEVIDKAERELGKTLNMFIVIHMDPIYDDLIETKETKELIQEILKEFPMINSFHDFRIVGEGEIKNIIFDVVINFDHNISEKDEEKIKLDIDRKVKIKHPEYSTLITVDRAYAMFK